MTKPIDGGPAFPAPTNITPEATTWQGKPIGVAAFTRHDGMSLRDWFAGQVMATALVMMNEEKERDEEKPDDVERAVGNAAFLSYVAADAMLAERTKRGAT